MSIRINQFSSMIGQTITSIKGDIGKDEMHFFAASGRSFFFYHYQDCCENVRIDDIIGDLDDLLDSPIIEAEEISSEGFPAPNTAESYTWTFYRFSTNKGTVTVRWLGESNGYYSESVTFAD